MNLTITETLSTGAFKAMGVDFGPVLPRLLLRKGNVGLVHQASSRTWVGRGCGQGTAPAEYWLVVFYEGPRKYINRDKPQLITEMRILMVVESGRRWRKVKALMEAKFEELSKNYIYPGTDGSDVALDPLRDKLREWAKAEGLA